MGAAAALLPVALLEAAASAAAAKKTAVERTDEDAEADAEVDAEADAEADADVDADAAADAEAFAALLWPRGRGEADRIGRAARRGIWCPGDGVHSCCGERKRPWRRLNDVVRSRRCSPAIGPNGGEPNGFAWAIRNAVAAGAGGSAAALLPMVLLPMLLPMPLTRAPDAGSRKASNALFADDDAVESPVPMPRCLSWQGLFADELAWPTAARRANGTTTLDRDRST